MTNENNDAGDAIIASPQPGGRCCLRMSDLFMIGTMNSGTCVERIMGYECDGDDDNDHDHEDDDDDDDDDDDGESDGEGDDDDDD